MPPPHQSCDETTQPVSSGYHSFNIKAAFVKLRQMIDSRVASVCSTRLLTCFPLFRFRHQPGDGSQLERHRQHSAGGWHRQVLEEQAHHPQETGRLSLAACPGAGPLVSWRHLPRGASGMWCCGGCCGGCRPQPRPSMAADGHRLHPVFT